MIRRRLLIPIASGLLVACGRPAPPPAPPVLGYGSVADSGAVYLFGDTARVDIDAGGETLEAGISTASTLEMEFHREGGALTVSASIVDFSARATNPVTAPETAGGGDIEGPLVFSLDRRGRATLVSSPVVGERTARFLSPEAMAATLLPRLPGRPVELGDRWTDTIRVEADRSELRVAGRSVVTYTVRGDTLVGATSLLKVGLEGSDHREISGLQSGMEMSQILDGGSTGWFLWDMAGGLLHEFVYESDLSGTMEVTAAPFPLSVRVRSRSDLRLAGGPGGG